MSFATWLNAFSLLFAPRKSLHRVKEKPTWLATFLVLATFHVVVYILFHPFLVATSLAHLPSSATLEEKEVVAEALRSDLPIRCFFLPLRLLVGWASFAFLLFIIGKAFSPPEQLRFIRVFSLQVHSEVFNLLAQFSSVVFLFFTGSSVSNIPVLVPISVAALIPASDVITFSLLNSLNFFTLLYIVALTWGLSFQSAMSRRKSLLVVLLTYASYVLFNTGTLYFLRDAMHLLV